jgi:ABC-type multidrug transport system permease subunit/ABC-type multidrug transport system ATPase subunit
VPRTLEEFEAAWTSSVRYQQLQVEIEQREANDEEKCREELDRLANAQALEKAPTTRNNSPYIVSHWRQFTTTFRRSCQRIRGEHIYFVAVSVTMIVAPVLIGSMFYNIKSDTSGFNSKGGLIFFVVLFSIIINFAEVILQFSQRAIVEKQKSYAMNHPFMDALATVISQYPLKILNVLAYCAIAYFLAGLKREAGPFLIFVLFIFITMITITSYFRTVAALTATVETALAIAGLSVLPMMVYSGYIIPRPSMHPWFKWISYINPIYYANEALMAVEFHGQKAPCAALIPAGPGYEHVSTANQVCPVVGAKPGVSYILGDDYVLLSSGYRYSLVWRDLGICLAFFAFFTFTYALATEFKRLRGPTSGYMVFRKSSHSSTPPSQSDLESGDPNPKSELDTSGGVIPTLQTSAEIFCWKDIDYELVVDGQSRRLLHNIQGYVKRGTLTALMGASGAGKTTLLNLLAQRVHVGVVSGKATIGGVPRDGSFKRRTGYVQQQDVHLAESTVREALRFSVLLRQPKETPISEKYAYVEEIISVLGMEEYADAVIGVPGKGLSAEKRKRTTIGIELVAKPSLLLFLDEPTSGLDSQSAYSIVKLLRRLADAGQAILCTIHQPSSNLFHQFDKVVLLAKGKTVYFGDTGNDCQIILDYFERNGAPGCAKHHNPAEYILDVVGAGATNNATEDWADIWDKSVEHTRLSSETEIFQSTRSTSSGVVMKEDTVTFATSWDTQFIAVQKRLFQQHWRSPTYIHAKLLINIVGGLFLGFTFYNEGHSVQSLQNKTSSIFMMLLLCLVLIFLLQPRMVALRAIYDVRERYSNMYHWTIFVIANILVEIPFNLVTSSLGFICWFFPGGWWRDISTKSCVFMWLLFNVYQVYQTIFAQAIAVASPNPETAIMITVLFYAFIFIFSGILQPFKQLVAFWHFAYYVSPFTWIVSAMMSAGIHDVPVHCSATDINVFQPPVRMTCGEYAGPFSQATMARLYNPSASRDCQFCVYGVSDTYLTYLNMDYNDRWRNVGFVFAYTAFNICKFFLGFYLKSNADFNFKRWVGGLRKGSKSE